MLDPLQDLFDRDREAYAFFQSQPLFVQEHLRQNAANIQTREEMSGIANNAIRQELKRDEYLPMFEDETDSDSDLQ